MKTKNSNILSTQNRSIPFGRFVAAALACTAPQTIASAHDAICDIYQQQPQSEKRYVGVISVINQTAAVGTVHGEQFPFLEDASIKTIEFPMVRSREETLRLSTYRGRMSSPEREVEITFNSEVVEAPNGYLRIGTASPPTLGKYAEYIVDCDEF